jgi:hypothetical protein
MARPKKGEETGWKSKFLIALANKPYVSVACKEANISRSRVYALKKTDEEFSDAWDMAMEDGLDGIEHELYLIGVGEKKGQYGALIYLLKARRYEVKQGQDMPSKITFEWGPSQNGDLPVSTSTQLRADESDPEPGE